METKKLSAARKAAMRNQKIREAIILIAVFAIVCAVICIAVAIEPKTEPVETVGIVDEEVIEVSAMPVKTAVLSARKPVPHKVREVPENEWFTETVGDILPPVETETVIETTEQYVPTYQYHTVNGEVFPLEEFLYNKLAEYGREDFILYSLCQCYQESRFDVYAVNPNQHDKGLFQFKDTYWDYHSSEAGFSGSDIFDPYVQCAVYAYWVDRRFDESADLYTTISDHYTGGYGYNSQYVSDVLQWLPTVE